MRRSGREGCCPAAGLGRGECEQRVRRAAGRTLHRNEVVAEIRCAFAALCRAGALLVAALRGHTPLPPLRSLPLRRARVRTYLFGRVNPARRRGAPDSLRARCPVAHRAWARAGTRNHRTHLFPGAGGWNERRSSRPRHAHDDAQRADFAPRRREIRTFPLIPRLGFASFGSRLPRASAAAVASLIERRGGKGVLERRRARPRNQAPKTLLPHHSRQPAPGLGALVFAPTQRDARLPRRCTVQATAAERSPLPP